MAGTTFTIDHHEIEGLADRLGALSAFDQIEMMSSVGAMIESQTRERIIDTKQGPDGVDWLEWSPAYAARKLNARVRARSRSGGKSGGKSLLRDSGALTDSIAWQLSANGDLEVGSALEYAAVHQFGSEDYDGENGTPPRPYLGISDQNEGDLIDLINTHLMRPLQ